MASPPSPTSSTSSSPSSVSSVSGLSFDPFAVHPFTSCTTSPNISTLHNRGNPSYAYPHVPAMGNYSASYSHNLPQSSPPMRSVNAQPSGSPSKSYANSQPRNAGIFVPFRKETSSPDLPDVLKTTSSKTNSFSSSSNPRSSTTGIPASSALLSSSRKH
ncbi:hypothetical protein B0H34DRAFT_796992 [Crassisporium funariophilum]|nr:hypothetical protein B0H34DRAFT_796992 [Crassisporium funariophilum]